MSTAPALRAAVLGAILAAAGCGPSFQAIYEGDSRFEHCYALDDNPNVPMQRKSDCWNDWVKHYTYGQTRDRVEYAAMRYRALSRVPVAPTDEAMMGAAPGEGVAGTTVSAPAPTNAFAPPPKTLADQDAGAPRPAPEVPANVPVHTPPGAAPVGPPAPSSGPAAPTSGAAASADAGPNDSPIPRAPRAECTDGCWNAWERCREGCNDKTCGGCDKVYGRCVKACF